MFTPEQVGPLLASNQIVLYELIHEGGDLESVFLSLTAGLGFGDLAGQHVIKASRSELIKCGRCRGCGSTFGVAFPLTVLGCLIVFLGRGVPGSHVLPCAEPSHRRQLLGAGSMSPQVLAPLLGVFCITSEYRRETITSTLLLTPHPELGAGWRRSWRAASVEANLSP